MTADQVVYFGEQLEKAAEEMAANAHALIVLAQEVQRRAASRVPVPDGPEGND